MPHSNTNDTVELGEEEIPSTNTLAPSLGPRKGQTEIARTEFDCHGINGEKQRVLVMRRMGRNS